MTLAAISVDHFLFIVKPHLYMQFMRPKVAVTLVVIIIIWLVAASLNSTPFFGYWNFLFTSYGSCVSFINEHILYISSCFGTNI